MKSFNQFKVDCFITEGAAEKLAAMSPEQITDYKKSNPGAASKVDELLKKAKTTKVPGSTFRNGTTPPAGGAPPAGGGGGLTKPPSGVKPPAGGGALVKAASQEASAGAKAATTAVEKEVAKTATKTVGKGILRSAGRLIGPASAALDVADERAKGSGWLRSLAKGATVAAGSALGGAAGTAGGPVGTFAGATGGAIAASKAFYANLGFDQVLYEGSGTYEDLHGFPGGDQLVERVILGTKEIATGPFGAVIGFSKIELLAVPHRKAQKIFRGRIWGDTGFVHLGLDVFDMVVLQQKLLANRIDMKCDSQAALNMGKTSVHCAYICDPDGVLIELIEVYKIPLIEKWGLFLNVHGKRVGRHLPKWIIQLLRFSRIKD